jgi:transcriptional regulator with XRE-family HTH domain
MVMAEEIRRELGGRIRRARRERLTMTLEEFGRRVAEMMGRSRAFSNVTASNWETGRQEPSWEALVATARLTHLPLEYFAGIGTLESYPAERGATAGDREIDPRLRSLMAAVQRADPAAQRLVLRQLEGMMSFLREEQA